jgi:Fe-S oxidoreductase
MTMSTREGSLDAPIRHPIDWRSDEYFDRDALDAELERVFDICHGCRRCFSLCHSFPTLFDLVDESSTGELDGVAKPDFAKVVEHCYLCDMCYMTKCPYVPPHEWNVDFPHLMLRAKANDFRANGASARDRLLSATDKVGSLAGIPVVAGIVNAVNASSAGRAMLESVLGVDRAAPLPTYASTSARSRLRQRIGTAAPQAVEAGRTRGRVAVFATCYGDRNAPGVVEDLVAIFEHNEIAVTLPPSEQCCGMPKLELGDLESVARLKDKNIPVLHRLVEDGWDLTACIPSCVLMFKQELPLMFPDDDKVRAVADAFFDPFDYLLARHKAGLMKTHFVNELGSVTYQVPCHLRVQNIGLKTRDVLALVPNTIVRTIERCSGHDGTYAVKKEYGEISRKIARPVARQVDQAAGDHFISDCPMAAEQIAAVADSAEATHPLQLLRKAYGI